MLLMSVHSGLLIRMGAEHPHPPTRTWLSLNFFVYFLQGSENYFCSVLLGEVPLRVSC